MHKYYKLGDEIYILRFDKESTNEAPSYDRTFVINKIVINTITTDKQGTHYNGRVYDEVFDNLESLISYLEQELPRLRAIE